MAFNISNIVVNNPKPKKPELNNTDTPAQENLTIVPKTSIYDKEVLATTISNLTRLLEVVQTFGLSRSILSFVDRDKSLSKNISGFPSIETLRSDKTPNNSKDEIDLIKETISKLEEVVAQESLSIPETKSEDHKLLDTLKNTLNDLTSVRYSVSRYGYTKTLAFFVDRNNELSKHIKEIPSFDTMTKSLSISESKDIIFSLDKVISSTTKRIKVLETKFNK